MFKWALLDVVEVTPEEEIALAIRYNPLVTGLVIFVAVAIIISLIFIIKKITKKN